MNKEKKSLLSEKFMEAMVFANQVHGNQTRKNSEIPYISHVLAVTALVLQDGGSETEAISALLHDTVEDGDGEQTLVEIEERFGPQVAKIVLSLSDTIETPKPPWRPRKEAYLEHLRTAPPEVLRVSLADKLHNARTIFEDLKINGKKTWKKFNGGKSGTLWYYRSLYKIFSLHLPGHMTDELGRVLALIEELARE
jgi:(p)ppGpp synthase/HD superfamily hydrolase